MTAAELDIKLWKILGTGNIRELRKTYDLFIIANNRERREKKPRHPRASGSAKVRAYRLPKPPKQPKPRPEPKKGTNQPLTITEFRALPIRPYG